MGRIAQRQSGKLTQLAAVVIARNEQDNIRRCLSSLEFCGELVVVDAFSSDATVKIASEFTERIYERQWQGYGSQKNYGISKTTLPWVLSIDADEEVSEELKVELYQLMNGGVPSDQAYSIPRKTLHSGKWIRHGGWYPNRLVRLFQKDSGRWTEDEVHESWETEGSVGALQQHLNHYSFLDISDQVERNNDYSSLGARRLARSGQKFSVGSIILKPFSKFVETFLIKQGFRDGFLGFVISVSAAYSVFLKWAKLRELEKEKA